MSHATQTTDPIKSAQEAITLPTTDPNRKRALRDAALKAAADAYGPFTVLETVELSKDEPKFKAWLTGARGRNGFIVSTSLGKAVVGETTVRDWIDMGAVTNPEYLADAADAPTMVGILS